MKRIVPYAVFGAGLLCISAASIIAVRDMATWILVGVIGINLVGWGFLFINGGNDDEEDADQTESLPS